VNKKYCVFIGDVALDEYYKADYWPTIKDKVLVDALTAVPGGMIANAACVAAALGMNVKLIWKKAGSTSHLWFLMTISPIQKR